ncbi:uncharacterized protein TRIADDRAFT_24653 [Trichoplax adhaerens]|uniref:Amine oxidase domain-containing protein n=1 Tax=Trichoplax adhaerens TaxID=10228 RepID=B3RW63_TRIAD|nr:hypothetical protein TRIADDRAFT_24653 [Trichoplax adhaerens]EDV26125.1 hypothetical protein TRIADDRAFT_24653 [Trichoplax adhaerens]|eukprot:XP_002112158.1 hypothetical protein TRIADDRAFT_24653 [Trichoplax adhaerens]
MASAAQVKSAGHPRCLLIGGGITASLISYFLHKICPSMPIEVWEKDATVGGRMMTFRSESTQCTADVGAQYITTVPTEHNSSQKIYSALIDAGILIPLTKTIVGDRKQHNAINYVAAKGMSSIVEHFLTNSGTKTFCNRHVKRVRPASHTIEVHYNEGISDNFEIVVFTIPLPEVYKIYEKAETLLQNKIEYSSRYALAAFYKNQNLNDQFNWCAKYINTNPCIRFICLDTKKRESTVSGTSIVVHTSVSFSKMNQSTDPTAVKDKILTNLNGLMPGLPPADDSTLVNWEYSQVIQAYDCNGAFILNEFPLLIAGGDSFAMSKFDGCLNSASVLSKIISDSVQSVSANI